MYIIATIFLIAYLAMAVVFRKDRGGYSEYTGRYITARLIYIPLCILEKLNYRYSFTIDTLIIQRYLNVYRSDQAEIYHKLYIADKLTVLYIWIVVSLFIYPFVDIAAFLAVCMLFIILLLVEDLKLNGEIKKKRKSIYIDFPEVINKFVLLIGAGVPIINAWCMMDCDKEGWIYKEIKNSIREFELGKSEKKVFEDFAMRCNSPEISRVMAILIQNSRFGSDDITAILKIQSGEFWDMRKSEAKKLAEEASTKMVFSLALMFIGILIMVVTPAVVSISQV